MAPSSNQSDWSKSFMYGIHKANFLIGKRLEQRLDPNKGLTFSQFLILMGLTCKKNASQTEIASFLNLTEATVSRHINALDDQGYLARKEDPKNQRRYILSLTAKGTKAVAKTQAQIESELHDIFGVVPMKDRSVISKAFDKVIAKLQESRD